MLFIPNHLDICTSYINLKKIMKKKIMELTYSLHWRLPQKYVYVTATLDFIQIQLSV